MAMVRRTITKEESEYLDSFHYKSKIGGGEKKYSYYDEPADNPYVDRIRFRAMIDEEEQFYMFYDIGLGDGERGIPMYFGFVHKDILGYLGVYEDLHSYDEDGRRRTDVLLKVVEYYYPNENKQDRHDIIGLINQGLELYYKERSRNHKIKNVDVISFVVGDWNEYYG